MVGVPRIPRCQTCKSKKIRCDEKWPTCGYCKKHGLACSGPTVKRKLVPGKHLESLETEGVVVTALDRFRSASPPTRTSSSSSSVSSSQPGKNGSSRRCKSEGAQVVHTQVKTARDGSRFHLYKMRIHPASSSSSSSSASSSFFSSTTTTTTMMMPPRTAEDIAAARLVCVLRASTGSGHDIDTTTTWLSLLPARAAASPPLAAAVTALTSSWANAQRATAAADDGGGGGGPPMMDTRAYSRAVRALRDGLERAADPDVNLLAAACLLERIERYWGRPDQQTGASQRSVHCDGINALMARLGPPRPGDELYRVMSFSNTVILLPQFVVRGYTDTYMDDEWVDQMMADSHTITQNPVNRNRVLGSSLLATLQWPSLARAFARVNDSHNAAVASAAAAAAASAAAAANDYGIGCYDYDYDYYGQGRLAAAYREHDASTDFYQLVPVLQRAEKVAADLAAADVLPGALARGDVVELEDHEHGLGVRYDYAHWRVAAVVYSHALASIVASRVAAAVSIMLGLELLSDQHQQSEHEAHARALALRVWRTYPYMRGFKPYGADGFIGPLTITYPYAADDAERAFVVSALQDVHGGGGGGPDSREWIESSMMDLCRLMTGQTPLSDPGNLWWV